MKFIEPLVSGNESEPEYLDIARAGMIAWNFHVSESNELPYDPVMKELFLKLMAENGYAKEILNRLVIRKEMHFSEYNHFIFKVEIRTKEDGSTTLYVESAPVG